MAQTCLICRLQLVEERAALRHGHVEYRKWGPLFVVEQWPEDPDTRERYAHVACCSRLLGSEPVTDKCVVCSWQLFPIESALSINGGRPWVHWACLMEKIDEQRPTEDRTGAMRPVRAPMRGRFRVPAHRSAR